MTNPDTGSDTRPVDENDAPALDGRPISPIIDTHTLEIDPPHALSSVSRWTCVRCGCAVLLRGSYVYGSASSEECGRAA